MSVTLDTHFTAETPEGISLALRPAGVVPRMLAFLVDALIRLAMLIGISMALDQLGGFGSGILLIVYFGNG